MQTTFNGRGFDSVDVQTFTPTFEGAQARRERSINRLVSRRHHRRERRAARAI